MEAIYNANKHLQSKKLKTPRAEANQTKYWQFKGTHWPWGLKVFGVHIQNIIGNKFEIRF